nr:hypothetical protein Itr_chr04CG08430 [Ipomoea trifida]
MFAPSPITNPPLIGLAPGWDFTYPEVGEFTILLLDCGLISTNTRSTSACTLTTHVRSCLDSLGNDVSIDANGPGSVNCHNYDSRSSVGHRLGPRLHNLLRTFKRFWNTMIDQSKSVAGTFALETVIGVSGKATLVFYGEWPTNPPPTDLV